MARLRVCLTACQHDSCAWGSAAQAYQGPTASIETGRLYMSLTYPAGLPQARPRHLICQTVALRVMPPWRLRMIVSALTRLGEAHTGEWRLGVRLLVLSSVLLLQGSCMALLFDSSDVLLCVERHETLEKEQADLL